MYIITVNTFVPFLSDKCPGQNEAGTFGNQVTIKDRSGELIQSCLLQVNEISLHQHCLFCSLDADSPTVFVQKCTHIFIQSLLLLSWSFTPSKLGARIAQWLERRTRD